MATEALIFVGIQGSGKSSFFERHFFRTHVRISLDMLRTRRREQILLEACLRAGQSFAIDNTNPSAAARAGYLTAARKAGFRCVAYYFTTPLAECLRRNALREGKERIPAVALHAAAKRIEPPAKAECFDEIHTVELTPENRFVVKQIV